MSRPGFRVDDAMAGGNVLRIPPHDVGAEQAVLGAIMLAPETFWPVQLKLKAHDFYRRDHQLIYESIGELASKDKPFDAVTMGTWFEDHDLAEQVAGGAYLVELATTTPSAANAMAYAEIVLEKSKLRRLIEAGIHVTNEGFYPDGKTSDEIMADAIARIESSDPRADAAGLPMRQLLKENFDVMQQRLEWEEDRLVGMRFGYPELEELLGGLQGGCSYAFGGRAKMGKSIILSNIADNLALQGKSVAVWSIEMSARKWASRSLSNVSGVEEKLLERPRMMQEHHWPMLTDGMQRLKDCVLTVYDDSITTIEKIGAQATMLKARGKLDAGMIDYLQLVQGPGLERRDLDVGHVSWGIKQLAKKLDVPFCWAFQINRGNEKGHAVRPPRPSDARESGNIEQDVDAMVIIHRPGYYDQKTKGTRCEVALNRNGETGIVRLEEQLQFCRFASSRLRWSDTADQDYASDGFDR